MTSPADEPHPQPKCEHSASLRAVAILELSKGIIAILASIALTWRHEISVLVQKLAHHLHLDPGRKHPYALITAIKSHASGHVRLIAIGVLCYAAVRLAEGAGLWLGKRWAMWLGAVSGAIYLPFELIEFVRKPGLLSGSVLALTIVIIVVLVRRLPKHKPSLS